MAKHLSKEELETDPLIENVKRATTFYNQNRTIIVSVLIGIIVVIGSLIGYRFYAESQEQQAQQLLSIAEGYYTIGDFDRALNGDSFELTYGFLGIANDFSGTEAGNLAIYYASVSSFKLGNIEDALTYFSRYDAPKGILGVGPISYHASILKANGSLEKSAETYIQAANWDENESTTPDNLLRAAEIYFELGNFEEAQRLTEQILSEYPDYTGAAETERLQGMIAASI
ncbi:MAG: tetratricopeptide repeat protein [Balneolales bacterium]|nr:tetratricopeptide repeat protein [Balneolales bacterium]